MKILAFDIGIKNLAWALIDRETQPYRILGLANENIMEQPAGGAGTEAALATTGLKCEVGACRNRGGWMTSRGHFCKRHLPETFQTFEAAVAASDLGAATATQPTVSVLKVLLTADDKAVMKNTKIKPSKENLITLLSSRIAFPIKPSKMKRASSLSPEQLHDAIRNFIGGRMNIFAQADLILIENQPAFKNPHMKTVQILLFSCIREAFYNIRSAAAAAAAAAPGPPGPPPCMLVHAKKKIAGADIQKGDAGYAQRKACSEERVAGLYRDGKLSGFDELFSQAKKKSDMADAICMCCDFT